MSTSGGRIHHWTGDVLDLKLFDAEELSGLVPNDGSVPLPLLGSVRLVALTLQQATLWVKQLMGEELLRPDLQLRVVKPRPIRWPWWGRWNDPASIPLPSVRPAEGGPEIQLSGLPTVVDAIQKAGGITSPNLRSVFLQCRLPGAETGLRYAGEDLLDLVLDGNQTRTLSVRWRHDSNLC